MTPIAVVLISLLLSMKDILHLFLVFLLINDFEEVNFTWFLPIHSFAWYFLSTLSKSIVLLLINCILNSFLVNFSPFTPSLRQC